jgi:solute carrier family 25 (mitochondrial citrate transporter), member 1
MGGSGKESRPIQSFLAGSVAGITEVMLMYPTELVKTKMQLFPTQYKSPFGCASLIVKESGFLSLYRGLSPLIVGTFFKTGLRFAIFDLLDQKLDKHLSFMPPIIQKMISGGTAGVAEALVAVIPMETVKTKFIHDMNQPNPKYKGLVHGVTTIVKTEGISGIYKGVSATVSKQGFNQMCRFAVQGLVNDYWVSKVGRKLKLQETFVTGGMAGFVSAYLTQPFDTAKTQMQGLNSSKYTGLVHCIKSIVAESGVSGLWKGITPRAARVSFSTA